MGQTAAFRAGNRAKICPGNRAKSCVKSRTMSEALSTIPVADIRDGGPLRHARQAPEQARALRDACLTFFPRAALPLIPALDRIARRWLKQSRSPYVPEIAAIAAALDFSGVWLLNASYQWGCTARALEHDGVPWIIRTLDWPFRGLGRHIAVTHMRGPAGDFFNVTWPGYVGALTAMAPGRFAACINQAPLWRRTAYRWLRVYDFVANGIRIFTRIDDIPPDQLLRRVFEVCEDYAAARRMLETTPVARPVIYTLVGCGTNERCVIERTETGFVTREDETCSANDWVPARPNWEGRIGTRRFFKLSFDEAGAYSRARRDTLAAWNGTVTTDAFDWVREPVLNPYTRLAVAMSPAAGVLRVAGYDLVDAPLPEPVTQVREIAAAPLAA
jgi:hypothetical protein